MLLKIRHFTLNLQNYWIMSLTKKNYWLTNFLIFKLLISFKMHQVSVLGASNIKSGSLVSHINIHVYILKYFTYLKLHEDLNAIILLCSKRMRIIVTPKKHNRFEQFSVSLLIVSFFRPHFWGMLYYQDIDKNSFSLHRYKNILSLNGLQTKLLWTIF